MKKSYFAKFRHINGWGVSIAIKHPDWFKGECYPDLYPHWGFLKQYFKDKDTEKYREQYYNKVLSKLDPNKVYQDLKGKTILCWESPKLFCHRDLVAEWLEETIGIKVEEI